MTVCSCLFTYAFQSESSHHPLVYELSGSGFDSSCSLLHISILEINMAEDVSLAFRLRKIDETKNYLLDEIKQ